MGGNRIGRRERCYIESTGCEPLVVTLRTRIDQQRANRSVEIGDLSSELQWQYRKQASHDDLGNLIGRWRTTSPLQRRRLSTHHLPVRLNHPLFLRRIEN